MPRYGGRKKGTPNKQTLLLKEELEALRMDIPQLIADAFWDLEPKEQMQTLIALLPYVYPKRKAIEHSMDDGSVKTFTDFIKSIRDKKSEPEKPAPEAVEWEDIQGDGE